ncbi:cupin domain-containing protein [Aeromicrobium sp.]|uniref:cupin domain-containing protein n=1 Tax=Aeromicrobium sp. TaxID=1871063 RepID=UPI0030BE5D3F
MTRAKEPSDRVLADDVRATPLTRSQVPSPEVVEGMPEVGTIDLATYRENEIGIWEITAGTVTDVEADEVFLVLSGRGEVRFEDDSVVPIQAGSLVRLHAGERTCWTIHETLRKVYFLL